jgi:nucleotide-binding universal stress UspA family protein
VSCYRRILVAVDGSPDAAAALRHAEQLARDQHAKLVVLTVVPATTPQNVIPAGALPPPIDNEQVFARILREAADALAADVGVETRLTRGRPARRIVEVAEETGCDLIVMGFHGHGRLHHALVGSVSDSVMRAGRLPVLLMRAGERRPAAAVVASGRARPARAAGVRRAATPQSRGRLQMLDEQQDTEADDVPEGAVSAEDLAKVPGPPERDGDNMAGPRAAAAERARQAAEAGAAAARAAAEEQRGE